jgi:predicted acyltransferase
MNLIMKQAQASHPANGRLKSLDALRGFDMFWIVGGASLVGALGTMTGWPIFQRILDELHHPEWNGFTFYDLIFPLFLFIAGVAMPYSIGRKLEENTPKTKLYAYIIRRGLTLVLLGLIYQGLFKFDFDNLRYPSVLGRIGLAWMFAGLIFLHTSWRGQLAWVAGLLLAYWAALMWIPVPEFGAGDLSPGHTLSNYIDRSLLPGRLLRGDRDPEGIFSTIPAVATALLGVLAGTWIRSQRFSGHVQAAVLLLAGLLCLSLGWFWDHWFPVNKNLWSSSFVLVTAGWSLSLLSLFYWIIDVLGYHKWSLPWVVIGMNAITAYLAVRFISFQPMAELVFQRGESAFHPALFGCLGFLLEWLILYAMYRRKWFLRV